MDVTAYFEDARNQSDFIRSGFQSVAGDLEIDRYADLSFVSRCDDRSAETTFNVLSPSANQPILRGHRHPFDRANNLYN